jgi:5-methylcytosine-specific restriction endonuclease McrA
MFSLHEYLMNWLSHKVSPSPSPSPSPTPTPATPSDTDIQVKGKRRKQKIPAAFREQIWFRDYGRSFEGKCPTRWCTNIINVFDFQSGHNIPESKGGPTVPDNLIPICARCNMSMGDRFTFTDWSKLNGPISVRQTVPLAHPPSSHWCC